MDAATRRLVRSRAGGVCEYCRLPEDVALFSFHVEHVIPRQHGGSDSVSNLALACHHCNLHKGPNLASIDPDGGGLVPLFDRRTQEWEEHFELDGEWIVGKISIGRATVRVLAMNSQAQRELRNELR